MSTVIDSVSESEVQKTGSIVAGQSSDSPVFSEEWLKAEIPVKVNGEVYRVPLSEVVAGYQMRKAAQEEFRSLAEKKRELEDVLERDSLMMKGLSGDQRSLILALRQYGLTDEVIQNLMGASSNSSGNSFGADSTVNTRKRQSSGSSSSSVSSMDDFYDMESSTDDPVVSRLMASVESLTRQVEALTESAKVSSREREAAKRLSEINEAIDDNVELATLINRYPSEFREELRAAVRQTVIDTARSPEFRDRLWGPSVIQAGLKKFMAFAKAAGFTPPKASAGSEAEESTGPKATIAPDVAMMLGIGKSGSEPSETGVMFDRKLKRIPPGQPGREENFFARLARYVSG